MIFWTGVLGIFTVVLAIFSGVADWLIYQQYSIANLAQSDAREQLRAVTASAGGVVINNQKEGKDINHIFFANFRNYGGTRTGKVYGWISGHFFEGKVPNSQDFSKSWDKFGVPNIIIPAGSTAQAGPVILSADDAFRAYRGQGTIVIWGDIDWSDIFNPDDLRHISFCLWFKPLSTDNGEHINNWEITNFRQDCNSAS
jgi:hypothetical protein